MRSPRVRVLAAAAVGLLLFWTPPVLGQRGPGAGGPGGGGRPGGDEGFGNNLAVPAVFTEGFGVLGLPTAVDTGLRPVVGEVSYDVNPFLDPLSVYLLDGIMYYPQQTTSHWRADWVDGAVGGEAVVVNWSDNITRQKWTPKSMVRVETVLYQNLVTPMNGFAMTYLYGKGSTEMWGTSGAILPSNYRTAYSVCARLRIQKIDGPGGALTPGVAQIDELIADGFAVDGPGGYSAEVNVSGNLIYGYNWTLSTWNEVPDEQKLGWWRLTFSLEDQVNYDVVSEDGGTQNFTATRNATLAAIDPLDLVDALFTPTLPTPTSSVLEIQIVANRKGGRKPTTPAREK